MIGPEQGDQDGRPLLDEPGAFKTNEMMLLTFIVIVMKIDKNKLSIDKFNCIVIVTKIQKICFGAHLLK